MKISEIKTQLKNTDQIIFTLPNGEAVPSHFHVTEVGVISKHFIDCGGTVRKEEVANFQLWNADDYNHRLHPEKLTKIIELSEATLGMGDLEIEVEYQGNTIEKYNLEGKNGNFTLTSKHTDCLAKDNCGIPTENTHTTQKPKVKLAELQTTEACCSPSSGCC